MAHETPSVQETDRTKQVLDKKAPTLDTSIETLDPKKSIALAPHVINLAFRELADYLRWKWKTVTNITFNDVPEANRFKDAREKYKIDLKNNPEVRKLFDVSSSDDVAEVNAFLKKKWFTIELKEDAVGSIYFAATFQQIAEWNQWGFPLIDGSVGFMEKKDDQIKTIEIPKRMVKVFDYSGTPVYEVTTASWDRMYVMKSAWVKKISQYGLDAEIRSIDSKLQWTAGRQDTWLILPQIQYENTQSIDWLIWTGIDVKWSDGYTISQAQMQTKLNITPAWFEASAWAAWAARPRGIGGKSDTIDSPFMMWIKKGEVITFVGRMWRESMISEKVN
jgi:hypothetical protein